MFLGSFLLQGPDQSLSLVRGGPGDQDVIADVEDTTLDRAAPERNFGGDIVLRGSKSTTILVRFGEVARLVPKRFRVKSASLVLNAESSGPISAARVIELNQSWQEGPFLVPGRISLDPGLGATFRLRRSGVRKLSWNAPGNLGAKDGQVLTGLTYQQKGETWTINGLGPTVNRWLERPWRNDGLAIDLNSMTLFTSSEGALALRPRLEITLEPRAYLDVAQPDLTVSELSISDASLRAQATVKNIGSAPSTSFSLRWGLDEEWSSPIIIREGLKPGESKKFEFSLPPTTRVSTQEPIPIRVEVESQGESELQNNEASGYFGGILVPVKEPSAEVYRWAESFNDRALARSRFSVAPEGIRPRITVVRGGEAMPTSHREFYSVALSSLRLPALGSGSGLLGGDPRFDGLVPAFAPVSLDSYGNGPDSDLKASTTGLLSGLHADILNRDAFNFSEMSSFEAEMPQVILIKALTIDGKPLPTQELILFDDKEATTEGRKIMLSDSGAAILPSRPGVQKPNPFGKPAASLDRWGLSLKVSRGGITDVAWLPAWAIFEAMHRGKVIVPSVEARFNVPLDPVDLQTNLAARKTVRDEANSFPAQLSSIVDERGTGSLTVRANGGWIEVDLGRDRYLGGVSIRTDATKLPAQWSVIAYGTGQNPAKVEPWIRGFGGPERADREHVLYPSPIRARTLRFVNLDPARPVKINQIRIFPVQSGSTAASSR